MKKIQLTVNGRPTQAFIDDKAVLLDYLRNELSLTGAKQSCDRKGQCGACTVIVNGRAVLSCLTKMKDLEGAEVITVEGLGTPANPHLIQEAFVLAGAVQCGFCTPGMIMAAKALLDKNTNPSKDEIKQALRRNLCRCTGYVKIIEAVELAGKFIRGEASPEQYRVDAGGPKLGVSHPRPSALIKACGQAEFIADLKIPGALELAAVRSPMAHAEILGIDASEALASPGVVGVMTAKDVKGTNRLKYIVADRPLLCEDKVRYYGDPVAVVAAETREQAIAAVEKVKVEYKPLPVLASPAEALAEGASQLHEEFPNECFTFPTVKGDADKALAESAAVVEAHYITSCNHQAPLEPEVCVSYLEGEGEDAQLVVIGRSINIHHHLRMIQDAVGWENTRYEEAFTGGQFGIKLEITSEGIAAAAALHFQRPVRYIPGLLESMQMTSKRHPFDMKVRLGADADGKLTGFDIDMTVDNGAYHSNGNVIINRALQMLSGSYNIPHVKAASRLVYTNNPWGSAARGAGPPQAHFALECSMNKLAEKLGIDPLEFRKMNSLHPGESKSTGQVVEEWPFPELCEAIKPHYERGVKEAEAYRQGVIRRGVGIGAGAFGIGGPGDQGVASVELDEDGGVTIYAAAADPGEGNDSMFTQIGAHIMGLPLDKVRLVSKNTDLTAASGPAAGSRITFMIGGGAVEDGLRQLKASMDETGAKNAEELKATGKPIRYLGRKKSFEAGPLDPETGQGPSFDSQVHALQLAEVEVNTETGEARVIRMTTAVDAGTVINPLNLEGQVQGGMDMGTGWALREQYIPGKTKDWVTFKYPSMKTTFDMNVIVQETPRKRGTVGAGGRRRDDHGPDRAGRNQRHLRRLRRLDTRPAGRSGKNKNGPGRQGLTSP